MHITNLGNAQLAFSRRIKIASYKYFPTCFNCPINFIKPKLKMLKLIIESL